MERRYVEQGRTEGGPYTLFEIRIELRRRLPSTFDPRIVASKIVELAQANPNGLTTYKALWDVLRPGEAWKGHNSQTTLGNALGTVIAYCCQNRLPILTVLVINGSIGALTDKAIFNIAQECRDLGMDTAPNDRAFVERQVEAAKAITVAALPAADR
ncbi:MAG TPA: hypothetical protein VFB13_14675 [Reyranella sp.]|jgi:hypothetical protein|nr:hypothetical protein [Reyranella sp.]